jgi:hypothetical protein
VAVCLAAVFSIYEYRRRRQRHPSDWVNIQANHPVDHNEDKMTQSSPVLPDERPTSSASSQDHRQKINNKTSNIGSSSSNNNNIWDMQCYLAIIKTASVAHFLNILLSL